MRKTLLFGLLSALLTFGFPAAAQELDAEYESDAITFAYPEDWSVCDDCFDDEFTIIIGNSDDAIDIELNGDELDDDEAVIYVITDIEPYLDFYGVLEEPFDDLTPADVEETYFMPDGYDYGRLRSQDDDTMAWLDWEQLEDLDHEGLDIVMQFDDQFVFVGAKVGSGGLNDIEDIIFAVADSLELVDDRRTNNSDDPNVYADEIITFEYPSDWVDCGCPPEGLVVIVGNNPDIIENIDAMEEGDIQVIIAKDVEGFLELVNPDAEWDDDLSLVDAMDELFDLDGDLDETEELELNGNDAAARFSSNEATDFEQLMVLIQVARRRVVVVYAISRIGTMRDFEEDVLDLAATIEEVD